MADRLQASQRESAIQEVCDSFSVDCKLPLRRPGQNLFKFLDAAGGTIERSCYSSHYVNSERETMRETTRKICLRAAKQQTGASPVAAVTIGSGSAALVG